MSGKSTKAERRGAFLIFADLCTKGVDPRAAQQSVRLTTKDLERFLKKLEKKNKKELHKSLSSNIRK